jgi:aminoglycoside phosphotransferase (APT) family kinase protein
VALPIPYEALYSRIQGYYPVLDEIASPCLVHWDLWDGNIFVDPETRQITGIIDCERALWGDPLMEVNFGAFGVNPALMDGYGQEMLALPAAKTRRALYNVYLWLIMIIECAYRQYDNHDQENWVRPKLIEEMEKLERNG